ARRQRSVAQQYAAASLAIVPVQRGCEARDSTPPADARRVSSDAGVSTAGPWAHVQPPPTVPAWVQCAGFGGVFAYSHATSSGDAEEVHLLVRGVAFPDSPRPAFAVVVDIPVT